MVLLFYLDLRTSKDILQCLENEIGKENLKRSRSLEAINHENSLMNKSSNSLFISTKGDNKRKLSGLTFKVNRKSSDTTGNSTIKRKISIQPLFRGRSPSVTAAEPRPRKVSAQPDLKVKSLSTVPVQKRHRKGSLQPEMMSGAKNKVKDSRERRVSVPANMKYNEKVRVRKVSFVNQNTGQSFAMKNAS